MTEPTAKTIDPNREKVMQRLHDEHTYMGTLRKAMADEISRLKRREQPDLVILRDMMRYLMEYPDIHHHPLEDKVFAKLIKHPDGVRSYVIELLAEHKDLAKESQYLYHKIDAVLLGQEKLQKNLLRASLTDFLEQYGEHVRLEESVVFPAAEALLSNDDWREIARALPAIDDPVFGMDSSERFARLRHRMAEGIDKASAIVAMSELLGVYSLMSSMGALAEGAEELVAFNRQQMRDFKDTNLNAISESASVGEALGKLARTNLRLIERGFSRQFGILRATASAAYLPFSESLGFISQVTRGK